MAKRGFIGKGFVRVTHVRCPDCEHREALRNDGGRRIVSGGALRGATKDIGVTTMSAGCPTCEGRGSIPTDDHQALLAAGYSLRGIELDPYSQPLSPELVARRLRAISVAPDK